MYIDCDDTIRKFIIELDHKRIDYYLYNFFKSSDVFNYSQDSNYKQDKVHLDTICYLINHYDSCNKIKDNLFQTNKLLSQLVLENRTDEIRFLATSLYYLRVFQLTEDAHRVLLDFILRSIKRDYGIGYCSEQMEQYFYFLTELKNKESKKEFLYEFAKFSLKSCVNSYFTWSLINRILDFYKTNDFIDQRIIDLISKQSPKNKIKLFEIIEKCEDKKKVLIECFKALSKLSSFSNRSIKTNDFIEHVDLDIFKEIAPKTRIKALYCFLEIVKNNLYKISWGTVTEKNIKTVSDIKTFVNLDMDNLFFSCGLGTAKDNKDVYYVKRIIGDIKAAIVRLESKWGYND